MKIELPPDTAEWVRGEMDSGRFSTAEDALNHAISGEEVRRFARRRRETTRATREHEAREPVSLHDILVAWQAGQLPYRRALALTGMSTVTDLYEAAANSGVEIRTTMLPGENRAAERATAALKASGAFEAMPTAESEHGR